MKICNILFLIFKRILEREEGSFIRCKRAAFWCFFVVSREVPCRIRQNGLKTAKRLTHGKRGFPTCLPETLFLPGAFYRSCFISAAYRNPYRFPAWSRASQPGVAEAHRASWQRVHLPNESSPELQGGCGGSLATDRVFDGLCRLNIFGVSGPSCHLGENMLL